MQNIYKKIPQVSNLLEHQAIKAYLNVFYYAEIKEVIEASLDTFREKIKSQQLLELHEEMIIQDITHRLDERSVYSLKKVVNGTGTIVHTNLGRSILSKQAIKNLTEVCESYTNLEYDIKTSQRGSRYDHVEKLIANLVGSEASLVVNNNAAATLLAISALSQSKEVIISRGELVEIGGSFRIPEIIQLSGATLKEVGTTNRTHLKDYKLATTEETAMYLKVHPSNYHVQGFTKNVTNEELVLLAHQENTLRNQKIITMEDLGSGAFIDFSHYNAEKEKTVKESLKSGVDVITFSGDKLLGGPQAGIIVGKKDYIERIKKHPLCRALRVCKMTIAALEGTLRDYYNESVAVQSIPTLAMIFQTEKALHQKAQKLSQAINETVNQKISHVIPTFSTIGGGALPLSELPSYGVTIQLNSMTANTMFNYLKNHKIAIIGRLHDAHYFIDVRTLLEKDEDIVLDAIKGLVKSS